MYDETAQLGYRTWSELETDVINGRVKLTVINIPVNEREKLIRPSPYKGLPHKKKAA